jgi:hypothetical protein
MRLLLALVLLAVVLAHKDDQEILLEPYQIGDTVKLECPVLDANGSITDTWGKGPICGDTGEELTLLYGIDAMARCVWVIDEPLYKFMRNVIAGKGIFQLPAYL